jgi:chemotaxis protein MotB
MPKHAVDDDLAGKPIKVRRFPWRLWLWALVMTAAAGAGGYFTWHYRNEAAAAGNTSSECEGSRKTLTKEVESCKQDAVTTGQALTDTKQKLTELTSEHGKIKNERDQLAKSLTVSKDELVELRTAKEKAEARIKAIDDIHKQFAKMLGAGELKIVARRGSLVLSLPAEVLFPSGVADLSKEGEIKVLEVGFNLKQFPGRRFMVLGHTDNQPPAKGGPYADNWALSTARALTVARVLAQGGVNRKNLIVAGAGEHDELVPNTSAAGMQRNRRIEIVLLPALDELPQLPPSLDEKEAKVEPKKP